MEDKLMIQDDSGYYWFKLVTKELRDFVWDFELYQCTQWTMDKKQDAFELYLQGSIKWDGCSHIWFGEKDEQDKTDGYLHLCGGWYWELHSRVMYEIWDLAPIVIKNFDKETAK